MNFKYKQRIEKSFENTEDDKRKRRIETGLIERVHMGFIIFQLFSFSNVLPPPII